jgi:hypothetical protein
MVLEIRRGDQAHPCFTGATDYPKIVRANARKRCGIDIVATRAIPQEDDVVCLGGAQRVFDWNCYECFVNDRSQPRIEKPYQRLGTPAICVADDPAETKRHARGEKDKGRGTQSRAHVTAALNDPAPLAPPAQ